MERVRMRIANDAEFLVNTSSLPAIIQNMKNCMASIKPIMQDSTIRRTLYKVVSNDAESEVKTRWIRILDGDVDCDGTTRCTITFKDRKKDMSAKDEYALLKVDNYDDATHLFDLLGFEKSSYQENLRTKFVCIFDDVKYIIRFDIWPHIEDVAFVAIVSMSSSDERTICGLIEALDILQYDIRGDISESINEDDINVPKSGTDVDSMYLQRFNYPASLIPQVTFDFSLNIPITEQSKN